MPEGPILTCPAGHPHVASKATTVCATCGQSLQRACSHGHQSVATAKFCPVCGESMAIPSSKGTVPSLGGLSEDPDPVLPPLHAGPPARAVMTGPSGPGGSRSGPWLIAGGVVLALALVIGIAVAATSGGHKSPPDSMPTASATGASGEAPVSSDNSGGTGATGTSGDSGNTGASTDDSGNTGNTGASQPQAGTAISTTELSSTGTAAMGIAQSLASALASHNWDAARSDFPGLSQSDSALESGYGGLDQSTVVVTGETDNGDGTVDLRGAYVAWETVQNAQQTSIYCINWDINPAAQQVVTQSSGSSLGDYDSGWVSPESLESVVQDRC